jgi:hypothetical protein
MIIRESTMMYFRFVYNAQSLADIELVIRGGAQVQRTDYGFVGKKFKTGYLMIVECYVFTFEIIGDEIDQDTFEERFAGCDMSNDKILTLEE